MAAILHRTGMRHSTTTLLAVFIAALIAVIASYLAKDSRSPLNRRSALIEGPHSSGTKNQISFVKPQEVAQRLAGALKYRTVSARSADNHALEPGEFKALHKYLRKNFPLVFKKLEVTEVQTLRSYNITTFTCPDNLELP